nr:TetR family transcriptional regulator [Labedaea rhizosphaerae]
MMSVTRGEESAVKRRGRRPAGADTRSALVSAARAVFAEQGYDGATVRSIATRAGVDAAMVNHWFGGKEGLFAEAILDLPIKPNDILALLNAGPVDELGPRIVRTFLTVWDDTGGEHFAALVRSVTGHEAAAHVLRDFFLKHVFISLANTVTEDRPDLRANLVASQLVGMGVARYVIKFEPLAHTPIPELVAAVGPTLQRYLTGEL